MGYYTDPQGGVHFYQEPGDPGYSPQPVDNTPIEQQIVNAQSLRVDPPPGEPIKGTVVGTSPKTNEVLIKTDDNRRIWVKSDEDTVKRVTDVINENERIEEENRGIEEANKWIEKKNQESKQMEAAAAMSENARKSQDKRRVESLITLSPFARGDDDNPQYDIVNALRNGVKESTLRAAGFEEKDIEKAKIDAAKQPSQEEFISDYFAQRRWTEVSLKKASSRAVAEYDDKLREATTAYVKKYGGSSLALTAAAKAGELFFQPARALRPEVKVSDLEPVDWIIGAGQVALMVTPFVAAKVAIKFASGSTKVVRAVETEIADTAGAIKKINPDLEPSYRQVANAQEKYVKSVLDLKNKEKILDAARKDISRLDPASDVIDLEADVTRAKQAVNTSRLELERTGAKYANKIKTTGPRVDDPAIKDAIDKLPGQIVKHTDNVIEDTLKAKGAAGETIEQMQVKLANAKESLPGLRKAVQTARDPDTARMLNKKLLEAQKVVREYPDKITKAVKRLDVESRVKTDEYGGKRIRKEQESRFGGRGGTGVKDKPSTRSGGALDTELNRAGYRRPLVGGKGSGSSTGTELRAATAAAIAAEAASRGEGDTELVNAVSTKTITRTGTKPSTGTSSQPGTGSQPGLRPGTSTSTTPKTGTRPETQPRPKESTRPYPAITTRTGTPVRPPYRPGTPRAPVVLSSDMLINKDGKLLLKPGSLVWEQGKLEVDPQHKGPETLYKYGQPPKYRIKNTFVEPKGYVDRGNTPRQTIQTIGGPTKSRVEVNLGVVTAIAKPNTREITFVSNKNIQRQRKPKPRKLKPISNNAFRIVRPHRTKRGGGITRRSNR